MRKIELPSVLSPTPYELSDAVAMHALALGEATPDQQKRALNWIIYNACGTYEPEFRSDAREHAAVSGRRLVGLEIVKMLKLNTSALVRVDIATGRRKIVEE